MAVLAVAALALVASACGSSGGGPKDAGGKDDAARGASDIGVSADEIKVGFVLTDLTKAKELLGEIGADQDDQRASYQAFVDEVNGAGGVNGRKLTPVFTSFDPVAGDAATACNKLTEDDKVFAVVANGIFGPPVLCITQQHGTPLLTVGGFINEYYEKSAGLLYSIQPTKPRSARNTVAALEQQGVLQGKTVGVFSSQAGDDDVAVKTALIPALAKLDHEVAHLADLAVDSGTALGQIPVEVTQMRDAHVDLVFLSTNAFFSGVFMQKADEQGYRPLYALSDADDNIADYFVSRMPASSEVAGFTAKHIGEQRTGEAEAATDADCRKVVEGSTGTKIVRGTTAYEMAMGACNQVRLLVRGAEAGGVALTRASWAKAMQHLGSFPLAYANGGSFSATKFDAADFIRPVKVDMTCKCWMPEGEFQKMRY